MTFGKMRHNTDIGIVELIDRTLKKGVILNADLVITVADVPLLAANLKLALASVETMLKYGMMTDMLVPYSLKEENPKAMEVKNIEVKNIEVKKSNSEF